LRTARAAQKRLVEQIALIDRERQGTTDAIRGSLVRQREELDVRVQLLDDREGGLSRRIQAGYETLDRILPFVNWNELRHVLTPVATIMAVLVFPRLYRAPGTCAFGFRSVYPPIIAPPF